MKILVLSGHTPSLFWFRMDMMRCFLSKGHAVVAVGNESEEKWKEKFAAENIKYIEANIKRNDTNPFKDIYTYISFRKILKSERPDKLFVYQAKPVIYGSIAAHTLRIKSVFPLIAGVGSVFLNNSTKAMLIRRILVTEYKVALKRCPNVFFQNNDDVALFKKYGLIRDEQVKFLNGSGVNLEKFKILDIPEKSSFLFIGRLIRDKGVIEYLEAAKKIKQRFPETTFMLVGPFDTNPSAISEAELQHYIDEGIVEYYGEQVDVIPYLSKCSVFVLPSYREGTPKTVLEAMASGRAVITTDAPGCRETVKNEVNGFLVQPKSVDALVEKMTYLIQNREAVVRMGQAGRAMAQERFDVNKVNEKICKVMNL